MTRSARRGYHPQDAKQFSGEALAALRQAAGQLQFLLDEGYSLTPSLQLVGNHHQLSRRQRMALQRTIAATAVCRDRRAKKIPLTELAGATLAVDGFNLIITLETALAQSLLLRGRDGAIRDLAGLKGTYRIIAKTDQALDLIFPILCNANLAKVVFYLDAPVSNSGRLSQRIESLAAAYPLAVETQLVRHTDAILSRQSLVVSSDSQILDRCRHWLDLSGEILQRDLPQAWIVSL